MKVIRDEEFFGVMMIPLLVDWGIRRCNSEGCVNKPNTIITQLKDTPIFGLCEEHFQMCNTPGGDLLNLEWDDFDAFKQSDKLWQAYDVAGSNEEATAMFVARYHREPAEVWRDGGGGCVHAGPITKEEHDGKVQL